MTRDDRDAETDDILVAPSGTHEALLSPGSRLDYRILSAQERADAHTVQPGNKSNENCTRSAVLT